MPKDKPRGDQRLVLKPRPCGGKMLLSFSKNARERLSIHGHFFLCVFFLRTALVP